MQDCTRVVVTDSKGCSVTAQVTISGAGCSRGRRSTGNTSSMQRREQRISHSDTAGGNGGYTYLWDNSETTATAIALNAGLHSVVVTDSKGCSITAQVTITEPDVLKANAVQVTPVVCNGESNGSATVTATGGNGGYTYLWDNAETTATAIALNAGLHSVVVTDSKGCSITAQVTITEPDVLEANAVQVTPVVCNGESNGSATVTATGGNGGYTYLWDNGETTATATALNAGLHSVVVTDSKGCSITAQVTITEPDVLEANAVQVTPVVCNGESNGSATVTATGGNGGYTYLWDNGETTATATALNAGLHSVVVTDSKGCSITAQVTITEPDVLEANAVQVTPVVCNGESNGSATVTSTGGNGGYTYLWDNAETTATAIGLDAGLHSVVVTDSKGCSITAQVTITEPDVLKADAVQVTPVVCNGESNGSATVTAAGGNGGYTYLWDNAEITATAIGLNAGLHSVVVTDSKGCSITAQVTITEPDVLKADAVQVTPVVCNGESNGSATVTAASGNGGYTYLWDNAEITATAIGLDAGLHSVVVTDSKGCSITAQVTITEPDVLKADAVQVTPVVCNGESNGSATVTAAGGNGGYTYLWDNGETTATTTLSLNAGLHSVVVTDSKGCSVTAQVTIMEPDALKARCSTGNTCSMQRREQRISHSNSSRWQWRVYISVG